MVLSRWKIVSSFLFLFVIHSHSQLPEVAPTQPQKVKTTKVIGPKNISDLRCPQVVEPEECPDEPKELRCSYGGKSGYCEEERMCCNIGCGMLDCVVPEVAPTQPHKVTTTKVTGTKNISVPEVAPTQPHKVRTTKVTGQKKISVPEVAPTQPQKVTTTEDPGNKNISGFVCPSFEEPAECPSDDEEDKLCQPESKIGSDAGCPPGFMCCNTGCHFLDCVVPEVARAQPYKVKTTKVTGPKNISGFVCPSFEKPAECPSDDDWDDFCRPKGKIGIDAGCPPGLMCCNTGCQFLDCVVPEVTPTPTQPQKVPVCEKLQNAFQNLKRQLDEIQKELKNLPKEDVDRRKDSSLPKNCAELYKSGETISGVYTIDPDGSGTFDVYCDQKTADGGWTVFQKRLDGSVDFYRGWKEYKNGFGNQNGEFWLGLDKIHRLTISDRYKLRVDLEDTEGNVRYAEYDLFAVASESTGYQLILGSYSGTAGNSLTRHRGKAFSTPDRDNDRYWRHNCASMYKGAWWFDDCLDSNLNGPYHRGKPQSHSEGIYWYHRKEKNFSAKRTEMKIKPVNA